MNIEDKDLFLQIREKDSQKAFDLLFHQYYVRLCRFAVLVVMDEAMAEEVVQETFINIWENRKSVLIEKSVSAYLYSAVRYRAINHYHRSKTRMKHEAIFASEVEVENNEPKKEIDPHTKAVVNEAIRLLPEKCQEIFCMARFEGLTHEEIAEYLNISKKTVENQMTIAFQKLREYVKENVKSKEDRRTILMLMLC